MWYNNNLFGIFLFIKRPILKVILKVLDWDNTKVAKDNEGMEKVSKTVLEWPL